MSLCSTWILPGDHCEPCASLYSTDPTLLEEWELVASELLFMATAQQFPGLCEVTVHPCSCSAADSDITVSDGISTLNRWSSFVACGCRRQASCSCESLSTISLPYIPANEVSEVVTTDDGTLTPSSYALYGQDLVRLDGDQWPLCDDGFLVTYTYGRTVPAVLRRAAAILACELYMGCSPDDFEGQCRLPRNVVSITRQGVSVAMQSAFFTPGKGKPIQFGIAEIDMAIALYNPFGNTAPSVILSADEPDLARLVP